MNIIKSLFKIKKMEDEQKILLDKFQVGLEKAIKKYLKKDKDYMRWQCRWCNFVYTPDYHSMHEECRKKIDEQENAKMKDFWPNKVVVNFNDDHDLIAFYSSNDTITLRITNELDRYFIRNTTEISLIALYFKNRLKSDGYNICQPKQESKIEDKIKKMQDDFRACEIKQIICFCGKKIDTDKLSHHDPLVCRENKKDIINTLEREKNALLYLEANVHNMDYIYPRTEDKSFIYDYLKRLYREKLAEIDLAKM